MSKTTIAVLKNVLPGLHPKCQLKDATKTMRVCPTRADANKARRLDPMNCLYGQTCQRLGHPALFFRNVAYVKKTAMLVLKYKVPAAGRAQIIALDASGIAVAGASITLVPPLGQSAVGGQKRPPHKKGGRGKLLSKKEVARRQAIRDKLPPERKLK